MMMKMGSRTRPSIAVLALAVSVLTVGCALDDADIPPLTGPSGLALSVIATATPDRLPRDGTSQSVIALNVRDAQNRPAAARPTITTVTVTPAAPVAGQSASFTAGFTVAPNHRIVSFRWQWGDGTTTTTSDASTTHAFSANGTYVVTVTATDDLGQSATTTVTVVVGSGVVASFRFSPTDPKQNDTVVFDGSASSSTAGATIVKWTWNFGDGSATEESDEPIIEHDFPNDRTYVVRLTVTDSAGRTATTTQDVTIDEP
jgi:PKD repeat protein